MLGFGLPLAQCGIGVALCHHGKQTQKDCHPFQLHPLSMARGIGAGVCLSCFRLPRHESPYARKSG
jgi:hypothetical protein